MQRNLEELFRYDENAGFTNNLKGSIATLMFLSEKRIISWRAMFPEIFRYSNKMILTGLQLKPLFYLFKLANYVPNLVKRQALSERMSPITPQNLCFLVKSTD
jgi:hypothetical protein